MVSRIDIGPEGGPFVELDEDAGNLVIRVPNNAVDFDSNDLLNAVLQNATMDDGSLDGVSLASALDADTQEIQNANLQNATLSDALDANNQDLNSVGTASVSALEAEKVNNVVYASEFAGSDADARLDNVLSSISEGDIIYLEQGASYSDDRTITTDNLRFFGSSGTDIAIKPTNQWTIDSKYITMGNIWLRGTFVVNGLEFHANQCRCASADIEINADYANLQGLNSGNSASSVTFDSTTSNCLIDSSNGVSITDNGTNTIGDIA